MSLWSDCNGEAQIGPLRCKPWRVVEAQFISSSRDLVASHEEHELLEALLESSKPPAETSCHYLIFSPFRYPPLEYGSRFGCIDEPSLWYGSLTQETAFAEVAHYRLKFFNETQANLGQIDLPMTAFQAALKTQKGVNLASEAFAPISALLNHPSQYQSTQTLGKAMRLAGVEAFIFRSARDISGKNVAAFTPQIFEKGLLAQESWRCIGNKNQIEMIRMDANGKMESRIYTNKNNGYSHSTF